MKKEVVREERCDHGLVSENCAICLSGNCWCDYCRRRRMAELREARKKEGKIAGLKKGELVLC